MYSTINFKSKKALKEAVASGQLITIYQPHDLFSNPKASPSYSGPATLEGPHFPEPHRWYATVELVNGYITKVS